MDTPFLLFNAGIFLLLGFLYAWMPNLLNPYLLFGVTVDDAILGDERISLLKKHYSILVTGVTLIVVSLELLLSTLTNALSPESVFPLLLIMQLVGNFILYLWARSRVKRIKLSHNPVQSNYRTVDTDATKDFKVFPYYWYILYFIITAVLGVLTLKRYAILPQTLATHFTIDGVADGFMEKSCFSVYSIPLTMFLFSLLFIGINFALKRAKRVSGIAKGKVSYAQEKKFRFFWSIALYVIGIILLVILFAAQLVIIGLLSPGTLVVYSSLGGAAVIMAVIGGLAFYTGQSGSRLPDPKEEKEVIDRDDDAFWKGGILYINRKDPSLFVPKRFGIGFTVNFGRPAAWIIVAALCIVIILSVV